jgi:tannase
MPEQNGTVTTIQIYSNRQGIHGDLTDSRGKRNYLNAQPSSNLADARRMWNADKVAWEALPSGLGGEYMARFLNLQDKSNLDSLRA